MSKRFELCEAAGLGKASTRAIASGAYVDCEWIPAADVEALLAAAPVVYGVKDAADVGWCMHQSGIDTHSARLICIEPNAMDTAEGLLRELLAERKEYGTLDSTWERARKLLGKREALADCFEQAVRLAYPAVVSRNPSDSECAGERDDGA